MYPFALASLLNPYLKPYLTTGHRSPFYELRHRLFDAVHTVPPFGTDANLISVLICTCPNMQVQFCSFVPFNA